MAYIGYNKLWESEFHIIVSAKDRVQYININQFKLKVIDTYQRGEKVTTSFELSKPEDVNNKIYLE